MDRRKVEIAIISDVHLGAPGCHAHELLQYLRSIHPKKLVLSGGFFDNKSIKKRSLPSKHLAVLQQVMSMAFHDTKVYYIAGHDDMLKKFTALKPGNITVKKKLVLQIDRKRYLITHGDLLDASHHLWRWFAKMSHQAFKWRTRKNRLLDSLRKRFVMISLFESRKINDKIENNSERIAAFMQAVSRLATKQNYDCVISGNVHMPPIYPIPGTEVIYVNSSSWKQKLTSLEYRNKKWSRYTFEIISDNRPDHLSNPFKIHQNDASAPQITRSNQSLLSAD